MLLAPVQLGSSTLVAVQLVAPVTVQVSVVVPPPAMVVGLALKLTTGAAEALPANNPSTLSQIAKCCPTLSKNVDLSTTCAISDSSHAPLSARRASGLRLGLS